MVNSLGNLDGLVVYDICVIRCTACCLSKKAENVLMLYYISIRHLTDGPDSHNLPLANLELV